MLIYVDGYNACGKSVLLGLLDGTPSTFVVPIQDDLVNSFAAYPGLAEMMANRDLISLRNMLISMSKFYLIEHFANVGRLRLDCSSSDYWHRPFNFDFRQYECALFEQLMRLPVWSIGELLPLFYRMMPAFWLDYWNRGSRHERVVVWGLEKIAGARLLLDQFPDAKIVSLRRCPKEVLATRMSRQPNADNFRSSYRSRTGFWDYIEANIIPAIRMRDEKVDQLCERYPERLKVIQFNDLILDPRATMRQVWAFLDMAEPSKGCHFSFNGQLAPLDFQTKMFSAVNDTSASLNRRELLVVDLECGGNRAVALRHDPRQTVTWMWRRVVKPRLRSICRSVGERVARLFG